MKILVDINHPAHVHLFRNLASELEKSGHEFLFTTRDKEITIQLLEGYGLNFVSFGKHYKSKHGKLWGILKFDYKLVRTIKAFKPDLILSMGSIYAAQAAKLTGVPHILFQDTEHATLQHKLSVPFANLIVNPVCFTTKFDQTQMFYEGYHELAYLHPNRFTPDKKYLSFLGVSAEESFVILRFVSWGASHDIGHSGISMENKIKAATEFSKYARVFITSEDKLPDELDQYRISIPPEKIHHVMAFSTMLFGESATMASESAQMGVPSIFIDNDGRGYTDELEERYGMVYNFTESPEDQVKAIEKGVEILANPNSTKLFEEKQQAMLKEKIDVTAFMEWLVLNYPESAKIKDISKIKDWTEIQRTSDSTVTD